ncbi:MAG: RNA 2',3'-cyclic phosphodiesterase [Boseongicola sp.]
MRLFLALCIPRMEREKIFSLQRRLVHGRAVNVDDLHITLVFLGNGTTHMIDELEDALVGLTLVLPPVKLSVPGVFGRAQLRSAWLGVTPNGPLEILHKKIARRALEVGFDVPKRKYVPHVTLARFSPSNSNSSQVAAHFEGHSAKEFESFQPLSVTLFRSMIGGEAPIYDALASFPISPP